MRVVGQAKKYSGRRRRRWRLIRILRQNAGKAQSDKNSFFVVVDDFPKIGFTWKEKMEKEKEAERRKGDKKWWKNVSKVAKNRKAKEIIFCSDCEAPFHRFFFFFFFGDGDDTKNVGIVNVRRRRADEQEDGEEESRRKGQAGPFGRYGE